MQHALLIGQLNIVKVLLPIGRELGTLKADS